MRRGLIAISGAVAALAACGEPADTARSRPLEPLTEAVDAERLRQDGRLVAFLDGLWPERLARDPLRTAEWPFIDPSIPLTAGQAQQRKSMIESQLTELNRKFDREGLSPEGQLNFDLFSEVSLRDIALSEAALAAEDTPARREALSRYHIGAKADETEASFSVLTAEEDVRPLHHMPAVRLTLEPPTQPLVDGPVVPVFRSQIDFLEYRAGLALYEQLKTSEQRADLLPWYRTLALADLQLHGHSFSEEEALLVFRSRTGLGEEESRQVIETIRHQPDRHLAAFTGLLVILQAEADAKARLGPRYDPEAFAAALTSEGPLPAHLLSTHLQQWIDKQEQRL
ncbi:DUF885 family protein [Parvularcula lutaonensis]|uniref:DUF885 family protein n=1 Tax=Parvularcula lutaonensis TaxID=491923 RepID=A0ABV7MB28_9PROT|nr:DUF885 family protein [Parvularcula lutaonensis]GGY39608.1 hypothetical protein GCM10007148_04910 [Parvularcula lutaonensis]